ncbi:MAG: cytidine deaminase [Planctomycetaceae bacterium]
MPRNLQRREPVAHRMMIPTSTNKWKPAMPDPSLSLPDDWKQLVLAARQARQAAYAPYSQYHVGAAVKTSGGDVFVGCNVENASYGLTICAERTAVCSAVAAGHRDIDVCCISLTGQPVPCGTCRQFLYEFNPDMIVLLDNLDLPEQTDSGTPQLPEVVRLRDLLPRAFHLE